jgi:hypothetical protein
MASFPNIEVEAARETRFRIVGEEEVSFEAADPRVLEAPPIVFI